MLPLQIIALVIAVLLITSILLQQRGSGLGDAFGGDSSVFSSRRGVEKVLFYLSVIFSCSFLIIAILLLVLGQ